MDSDVTTNAAARSQVRAQYMIGCGNERPADDVTKDSDVATNAVARKLVGA